MDIFSKIQKFIDQHNLISYGDTIIIGLSGGPDSVFLLYFLKQLKEKCDKSRNKLELVAAHLDHQWRKDSYKDIDFCKELSQKLDIKFESTKAQDIKLNNIPKGSLELLGRTLRRTFFENLLKKYNANSIALGQHLNDQEETFFIRLIRGASLSGLSGIWPKNGCYIHPLLEISKIEILNYLDSNNIKYLIDPTNISDDYLRNRIRNKVIPAIRDIDKRFDKNFDRAITSLQESELFISKYAKQAYESIIIYKNSNKFLSDEALAKTEHNNKYIDIDKFFSIDSFLHTRVLLLFLCEFQVKFTPTQKFFNEIIRFFRQTKSNNHQIYQDWSLSKTKNLVTITYTP